MRRIILITATLAFFTTVYLSATTQTVSNDNRHVNCVIDQAISAMVDPKGIQNKLAAAGLFGRAYVIADQTDLGECAQLIRAQRKDPQNDYLSMKKECSAHLFSLPNDELEVIELSSKRKIKEAQNLKGSMADRALGRCVEFD